MLHSRRACVAHSGANLWGTARKNYYI